MRVPRKTELRHQFCNVSIRQGGKDVFLQVREDLVSFAAHSRHAGVLEKGPEDGDPGIARRLNGR
jgi:hypothetical protein